MPPQKLLSAAEIAALKLPGLPSSKGKVIERAASEGWYFEERKGIGGTRRVYAVPERYLPVQESCNDQADHLQQAIASISQAKPTGPTQIDLETLRMVETLLDQTLQAKGLSLKPEKRGAVVAFLYDYAVRGGGKEGIEMAVAALVA
ncbi:hypothetical protein [Paludibacterium sp. B53371]|uniref:hypothetical protein n=1 Tax=Paludibacterium sp. B53371 TaxID=2806263 RepID=UPI001C052EE4|nr:hypothetical protein [Paludibacterium sp. B53371]